MSSILEIIRKRLDGLTHPDDGEDALITATELRQVIAKLEELEAAEPLKVTELEGNALRSLLSVTIDAGDEAAPREHQPALRRVYRKLGGRP